MFFFINSFLLLYILLIYRLSLLYMNELLNENVRKYLSSKRHYVSAVYYNDVLLTNSVPTFDLIEDNMIP